MIKLTHFQQKVFSIVKKIPKGKTTTYKAIAQKLKTSPRAVGQALAHNPTPIKVPCHRVICSNGKIGGYKGKKNNKEKAELLKKEGAPLKIVLN